MKSAEHQAYVKTLKNLYFTVTLAFDYKTTHIKYFLVSEWGSTKDSYEIREKAYKKASSIVAALSERDGIAYQYIRIDVISKKDYTMLCKYFTHYIDASLRFYDTASGDDEREEAEE